MKLFAPPVTIFLLNSELFYFNAAHLFKDEMELLFSSDIEDMLQKIMEDSTSNVLSKL